MKSPPCLAYTRKCCKSEVSRSVGQVFAAKELRTKSVGCNRTRLFFMLS